MSRKMKIMYGTLLCGFAGLLGIIAIIMLAAPGIAFKKTLISSGIQTQSLAEITFGGDNGYAFSVLNLIPMLLVLVALFVTALTMFNKVPRRVGWIAALCFIAAGVLYLLCKNFVCFDLGNAALNEAAKESMLKTCTLGAGAIVAGVFSLTAGVCMLIAPALLQRKKR